MSRKEILGESFSLVLFFFLMIVLCTGEKTLVAHWDFDNDPDGAIVDEINRIRGEIKGDGYRIEAIEKLGMKFDGTYYIEIDSDRLYDITESSFSWSAWYFPDTVPISGDPENGYHQYHAIISKGVNPTFMSYTHQRKFRAIILNETGKPSIIFSEEEEPNAWYNVVLTVDDNQKIMRFYINGKLVGEEKYEGALVEYHSEPVRIGACREPVQNHDNPAKGIIDEIRIYNYALDEAKIINTYDREKPIISSTSTPMPAPSSTSTPSPPSSPNEEDKSGVSRFLDWLIDSSDLVQLGLLIGAVLAGWTGWTGLKRHSKRFLFCWNKIPGADEERLRSFIIDEWSIGWVNEAKIKKNDSGDVITISSEDESVRITLSEDRKAAFMKNRDRKTKKLDVKEEHGDTNIYI